MLKYCLDKWNKNRDRLEDVLRTDWELYRCDYEYLVKLVIKHILNDEECEYGDKWDADRITTIDNGDYQGTLLFVIPNATYQPSEYEYLLTYIGYGSCSVCDYLQSIQPWEARDLTDQEVKNFMALCKDILTNIIKPWNQGWRHDDRFEVVTMEDTDAN